MNIQCPFCQNHLDTITGELFSCKKCSNNFFDKHHGVYIQYFDCLIKNNQLIDYHANITIDNKLYAFDSSLACQKTMIYIFNYANDNTHLHLLTTLNFYVPIPENREIIKNIIKRILNIKAFL